MQEVLMMEKDVATFLGVKARTLQAWRLRGKGPPFVKISRRAVRYRRADVECFVEGLIRKSTSDVG